MPNDITMTEITTSPKLWKVGYSVDAAGTKTKTLNTSGTFLDRNIGVEIITPSVSGSIGGTASSGSATAAITNVNNIETISNISGKTAGTDYWAIKATATGGNGSYTPKYTVSTAGWLASTVTGTAQTVSVTSDTTGKFLYIPKATYGGSNGNITVTSAGYLPANEVIASMDTVTPAFDGGTLSSSSDATFANITTSSTDNGIKIQTRRSASYTDVLYNGAVSGYVSVSDNTVAKTGASVSNVNGTVYYVTGITVPKDKPFSLTTTADTALDSTSNISITNNAYRQLAITNNTNGDVNITTSGRTDVIVGSSSAGVVTVKAYPKGTGTTIVAEKTIVSAGRWAGDSGVKTPSVTSQTGPFYGEIYVAPMSSGTAAVLAASGTASASFSVAPGNVTISADTTAVSGKTRLALTPTTATSGISTYYIAIKANAAANSTGATSNISGTASARVSTAGYAASSLTGSGSISGTATATTTSKNSSVYYIPIPKATYGGSNGNITITSAGYLPANEVIASMDTVTPTFKGGALNSKGASATGTNAILGTSNNSGISILAKGTAGRDAVLYDGAVSGYISASDNTVASAAVASSAWNGTTYYLKEVTLAKPSSGSREFGIKVPNGDSTITFVFHVDSSGNVTVDDTYTGTYS